MHSITEEHIERINSDLERLSGLADDLRRDLEESAAGKTGPGHGTVFTISYQKWYSETCLFLRQVLPGRLDEFELLYFGDVRRKAITVETYAIRDWLLDIRISTGKYTGVREIDITLRKYRMQCWILESVRQLFQTSLTDVEHILRADLDNLRDESTREKIRNAFMEGAETTAAVINRFIVLFKMSSSPSQDTSDNVPEYDTPPAEILRL